MLTSTPLCQRHGWKIGWKTTDKILLQHVTKQNQEHPSPKHKLRYEKAKHPLHVPQNNSTTNVIYHLLQQIQTTHPGNLREQQPPNVCRGIRYCFIAAVTVAARKLVPCRMVPVAMISARALPQDGFSLALIYSSASSRYSSCWPSP